MEATCAHRREAPLPVGAVSRRLWIARQAIAPHHDARSCTDATGIDCSTLSKILNLKGYSTGTDILDRLCGYFDCRIEDLIERVSD